MYAQNLKQIDLVHIAAENNVIKKEKLLLKRDHRLINIRKNYLNQTISAVSYTHLDVYKRQLMML